tara:strand:- start:2156 stop:3463 length:1308 start_codon:yes stop_codon:yes gene_type:complete
MSLYLLNRESNIMKMLDELSRREFAKQIAKSYLGVSSLIYGSDLIARTTRVPTARHVIFLNMRGGMTHIDTFDPKPDNKDVMGETTAINTSADGIQLGHWLPKTAEQMHLASLVRSINSNQGAHEQANYLLHTSYQKRGTIIHPSMGSWISKLCGKLNKTLPDNVKINGGSGIIGAGYFESKYGPLPLGNPNAGIQNVKKSGYVENTMYNKRLEASKSLNNSFSLEFPQKQVRAYSDLYDNAIGLMKSKDLEAFDLSKEPDSLRDKYGRDNFGQGCLLARRLIENKVRFVEVSYGGWDMHNDVFGNMETRGAVLDSGLSSLLEDLNMRGMLADTMVVVASEFGRTPEVKAGRVGRDHHPSAFSVLFAGGGVKEGFVYGKSDERAHYVEENGVDVPSVNATIAYAMGLSIEKITYSPSGRPFKVSNGEPPILDLFS